jgi:hypothetical protein
VTYQRIERTENLPPAGALNARAREKQDLDFNTFADSGKMWEHAKDVAAFANSLGGVLLIGADNTTDPTVLGYPGLASTQTVADVATIYEKAGVMCSPAQNVDVVPIKGPGNVDLVAVNVDPCVDQVVASPGGHPKTGILGHLWRFPVRRGSLTDDINPEDLAMFMNRQARRAYLMVARIPPDKRSRVDFYFPRIVNAPTGTTETRDLELCLHDMPRERNFIVLEHETTQCRIPLSDILDVWEKDDNVWAIKVSGTLTLQDRKGVLGVTYHPRF